MEQKKLSMEDLSKLTALQVPEDERVRSRFISLYNTIHKNGQGELFYEKEKYNIIKIIAGNANLKACTAFSVYGCFLDVAAMGLSLDDTGRPMLYILFRNYKEKDSDGKEHWRRAAYLEVSPYGELALRIAAGQLKYCDNVRVVYEGDIFRPIENERGENIVVYEKKIPQKSTKIIGSFVRLIRPDGSHDFFYMTEEDIKRLQSYSDKKNRKNDDPEGADKSNALYTSYHGQIDPGFLEAKTLKHAFGTFPKIPLGQFSQLQVAEKEVQLVDYGLEENVTAKQVPDPQPFTLDDPSPNGLGSAGAPVTITDNDEDTF
jgi:hypothetical protein